MVDTRQNETQTSPGSRRLGQKRGPYDSDLMIERRRRMVDTAKQMIAESGGEGFTIRDLTRRAEVSVTVVYSAYGDKEGLVAAAIQDFYESLPLARRRPSRTLGRILQEIDQAAHIILANEAYSRAVAELYFSRTVDARVYATIREIAVVTFRPWLEDCLSHGETVPGLSIEAMSRTLANDRWATIFDWARGRIPDGKLAETMKTSFLITATGATTGSARQKVEAALAAICGHSA